MCTSRGEERVRGADDGADVEVVLPVLDRDVEVVPAGVEVGDDRLHRPVAVAVDDVAAVALGEQRRVVLLALGPGPLPRPDADLGGPVRHRVVRRPLVVSRRDRRRRRVRRTPSTDVTGYAGGVPFPRDRCARPAVRAMLLGINWLDPDWLLERVRRRVPLGQPGDRLRRVRAVLPVPAGRHPAVRARAVHRRRRLRRARHRQQGRSELPIAHARCSRRRRSSATSSATRSAAGSGRRSTSATAGSSSASTSTRPARSSRSTATRRW